MYFNFGSFSGYGRSLKGKRATKLFPDIRAITVKIMASICSSGFMYYTTQKTNVNRESLKKYLLRLMAVLRRKNISGAAIIMDNAAFHKGEDIRDLIYTRGHKLLYLPPYSPFFNPIENMFAQWKGHVRSSYAKSMLELKAKIFSFNNVLTHDQIVNYVGHASKNVQKYLDGVPATDL